VNVVAQEKRLRLGLLGAGRRGQVYLSAIAGLPDRYDFVAVCDANEAKAQAAAGRFGAHAYSDVREFFSREQLDVVTIATPAECHHLLAKMAAEHGVHMLIETPLAPTRAMMDCIGEAAAKHGVRVEVAENTVRRPEARLNHKALDAGLIGKVLRVSSFYEPIGRQGCYHSMSMLRYYAGSEVEEVIGFTHRSQVDRTASSGETWTQALLFLSNGVLGACTFVSSWLSPLRRGHPHFLTVEGTTGFIAGGRGISGQVHCVDNDVQLTYPLKVDTRRDNDREIPIRFYYETDPPVEHLNPFVGLPLNYADSWGASEVITVADELNSIHQAVVGNSEPDYGIDNARRDQELSIAISESAMLDRRPVRLPLKGETSWERERHEDFRSTWGGDPFKDADRLIRRNFSSQ